MIIVFHFSSISGAQMGNNKNKSGGNKVILNFKQASPRHLTTECQLVPASLGHVGTSRWGYKPASSSSLTLSPPTEKKLNKCSFGLIWGAQLQLVMRVAATLMLHLWGGAVRQWSAVPWDAPGPTVMREMSLDADVTCLYPCSRATRPDPPGQSPLSAGQGSNLSPVSLPSKHTHTHTHSRLREAF